MRLRYHITVVCLLQCIVCCSYVSNARAQQDSIRSIQRPSANNDSTDTRALNTAPRVSASDATIKDSGNTTKTNTPPSFTGSQYYELTPLPVRYPVVFAPFDQNLIGFSFLQSASGNWLYGEQNYFNMRINAQSVGDMEYGKWVIKRSLNANLGARYSQDSSAFEPVRVSDNEFFAEMVGSYNMGWSVNPYVSASLKTPITESFIYGTSYRRRTASFWDPVTTMQSIGFNFISYKGFDYYSARAGFALYQTRARTNSMLTDNWFTPQVEFYKSESGIETVSEANVIIDSSIFLMGRLELFGSLKRLDVWMVNSRNQARFRVWKFIDAVFAMDIIHDIRLSRRTQWRQSLMIGVSKQF
jgi:hypothetical protein